MTMWQSPDVRMAEPADREAILALTALLHNENGLFALSPPKVQRMLDRYFDREGAVIGVIGSVGKPVGTIYLGLDQLIYTDDYALVEQWNFVHPDHRRTNYATQLIAYAKNLSDEMKMPLLTGILSNKRTEAKVRLYERQMEKAGAYFCYNRQFSTGGAWD